MVEKAKIPKFFRDITTYLGDGSELIPGPQSPICRKCTLDKNSAKTLYAQYAGAEQPLVTFVFEAPSAKEDEAGGIGLDGPPQFMLRVVSEVGKELNIDPARFRWATGTRCAVRQGKGNPATGGKWCRYHLIQDFIQHPPKLIVPMGSVALGLLNHKSNAQDWGGKLLTWRGWPDDWLTDAKFEDGHPIYGERPTAQDKIPLFPLQKPQIIFGSRNPRAIQAWKKQVKDMLQLALSGVEAKTYDKPWWKITEDPDEVIAALSFIEQHPGLIVTYDTETTGLRPFLGNKIVFMMVRWNDPATNEPRSLGWPWDYDNLELIEVIKKSKHPEILQQFPLEKSPMLPHLVRVAPHVLRALSVSKLRGHNLTFDQLFTVATVPGGLDYINPICKAFYEDSWHMRYCLRQERGSLGLELLAYDFAKDLAGYEEDMTLMIERYRAFMQPEEGGHYANCPKKYWQTHFRPYVMGDVEVCHEACDELEKRLAKAPRYAIPIAHPEIRGKFRYFTPPGRDFVYNKILAPAASVLTKMMARGMHVDPAELANQEQLYPRMIFEARDKLRQSNPGLTAWCKTQEAADPEWEFDLENKGILKHAMFGVLNLPINNLTEAGAKIYKKLEGVPREDLIKYASTDKFTLNGLAVAHPEIRPLLEYRTTHKAYTSFVRPLRNITTPGIDRNPRKKDPILMLDGRIHASFKIPGTRTGRLGCCVDGNTILEIFSNEKGKELVKIKDLQLLNYDEVLIMTHKYRLRRILNKYEKQPAEMFEVKTNTGERIVCTAGHRFLTRSGWKQLRDISESDFIKVDTRKRRKNDSSGKRLQGYIRQVVRMEDPVQSRIRHENVFQNCTGIPEQIRGEKGRDKLGEFIYGSSQKTSKDDAASVCYTSERGTRGNDEKRCSICNYCETFQSKWIYSREKSSDIFTKSFNEMFWFTESYNRKSNTAFRSTLSRDIGSLPQLRGEQRRIYKVSSSCVPEIIDSSLVDSRFLLQFSEAIARSWPGSTRMFKRGWMESEQSGSISIVGIDRQKYQTCQRIQVLQEVNGRFCYNRDEYTDRSRRWHSQQGNGCHERRRNEKSWIYGTSIHDGERIERYNQRTDGNPRDDETKIVSIRPVGIRKVWDIEVEDDHSYMVHGLVSHNSEPNLQQIPREGLIKRLFGTRFGKRGCLYQADLSQIELRLLACACGDPRMVAAYVNGQDLHSLTASNIFRLPYEHFLEEYDIWLQKNGKNKEAKELKRKRKISKTANFLTGYGGGALGFQSSLATQGIYLPIEECETHLNNFFDTYPYLKVWISYYKRAIQEKGLAVSPTGRVRILDEVFSDDPQQSNKALRAGVNHAIQSWASDMMLGCLVAIEHLMREDNLESMLISTVHDSLVIDAVREEIPKVHEIVTGVLENIPEVLQVVFGEQFDTSTIICPLGGSYEVGPNYLDQKTIGDKPDWDQLLAV